MRTFARKQKPVQKAKSLSSAGPSTAMPGVGSILYLQRTIGSRAVQRLLRSNAEDSQASAKIQPKLPVDAGGKAVRRLLQARIHKGAARAVQGPGGRLPHLDKIQESFGSHDVSKVLAHIGNTAKEACEAVGAEAFATGNDVAFKEIPDLHTAAHEAAHIVQQRHDVQLEGGVGQAGDALEQHADAVADLVVRGESAESLLDTVARRGRFGGDAAVQFRHLGEERFFWYAYGGGDQLWRTVQIETHDEHEWRRLVGRGLPLTHPAAAFLRAAYIPRDRTPEQVALEIVFQGRVERDLEDVPTYREKLQLAKALYLRGGQPNIRLSDWLLSQLVAETQADLVDRMGRAQAAGHPRTTVETEDALGVAEAGWRRTGLRMLASGAASLTRHCAEFLAESGRRRAEADRSVRNACHIIRGAVTALNDQVAEQRAVVEGIVGSAFAVIPTGSMEPLTKQIWRHIGNALKSAVAEIMIADSGANDRLEDILRTTTEQINTARGVQDAVRRELLTTVRAELAVQVV